MKSPGSATALIGFLDNNKLEIASLGDSGFIVLRPTSNKNVMLKIKSRFQEVDFNIPFQLTCLPQEAHYDKILEERGQECLDNLKEMIKTNQFVCSRPEHAEIYELDLLPGDIIIAATDGLFDNLFTHEIKSIVQE